MYNTPALVRGRTCFYTTRPYCVVDCLTKAIRLRDFRGQWFSSDYVQQATTQRNQAHDYELLKVDDTRRVSGRGYIDACEFIRTNEEDYYPPPPIDHYGKEMVTPSRTLRMLASTRSSRPPVPLPARCQAYRTLTSQRATTTGSCRSRRHRYRPLLMLRCLISSTNSWPTSRSHARAYDVKIQRP